MGKCTLCGSCVKLCPVDNVVMENNKITFKDKCVRCFACIQWCPTGAIEFGRLKINEKVHYINPHIKMSEIIEIHQ